MQLIKHDTKNTKTRRISEKWTLGCNSKQNMITEVGKFVHYCILVKKDHFRREERKISEKGAKREHAKFINTKIH